MVTLSKFWNWVQDKNQNHEEFGDQKQTSIVKIEQLQPAE